MNRTDRCPECGGGGLVAARGCTGNANAHTCTPAVCTVCHGAGSVIKVRLCQAGRTASVCTSGSIRSPAVAAPIAMSIKPIDIIGICSHYRGMARIHLVSRHYVDLRRQAAAICQACCPAHR